MSFSEATANLSTSLRSGRDDTSLGCFPLGRKGSSGPIVANPEVWPWKGEYPSEVRVGGHPLANEPLTCFIRYADRRLVCRTAELSA
jgi:hypothetical protein